MEETKYYLVSLIFSKNKLTKEISDEYTNLDKCKFDAIKILSDADKGNNYKIIAIIIDSLGGIQYMNCIDTNFEKENNDEIGN